MRWCSLPGPFSRADRGRFVPCAVLPRKRPLELGTRTDQSETRYDLTRLRERDFGADPGAFAHGAVHGQRPVESRDPIVEAAQPATRGS